MGVKYRTVHGKKIKIVNGRVADRRLWGKNITVSKHRTRVKNWSRSRDSKRSSKKAGWRVSKRGKIYYEGRVNRSDVGKI